MTDYRLLVAQARALIGTEPDFIANAANFSALVFDGVDDLNWAGFYFLKDGELVVGPFQGKPACVRIAVGAGVCGTALAERRSIAVPDVHAFDGHIVCDANSRSEAVIPLMRGDEAWGVFDLDSPTVNRFSDDDLPGLEMLVAAFLEASHLSLGRGRGAEGRAGEGRVPTLAPSPPTLSQRERVIRTARYGSRDSFLPYRWRRWPSYQPISHSSPCRRSNEAIPDVGMPSLIGSPPSAAKPRANISKPGLCPTASSDDSEA